MNIPGQAEIWGRVCGRPKQKLLSHHPLTLTQ